MIEISGVYKAIEDKEILKNINLSVGKGGIFGLIGPNGAGKTTLIKCMTGIWKADRGSIKINGEEIFENPEAKSKIGYVPDQSVYYSTFKVNDILKFYKLSYRVFDEKRYYELNKIFKIPDTKYIGELSKGMKTRLSIMLNLSICPDVLVLDEPTSGLDPIVKREVTNLLLQEVADKGTTMFISSHNLSDLERICDGVAIIHNGEIKYFNSIENMKHSIKKFQVVFKENAPQDLKNWDNVINLENTGRVYYIVTDRYSDEFYNKLLNSKASLIEEISLSLEDMFLYSIGGSGNYEEIFK